MAVYRNHDETNFDRDDGLERETSGQSIADRYDYGSVGVEAALEGDLGRFRYDVDLRIEDRDYKDTVVVSQYDYDYSSFGGSVTLPFETGDALTFGYSHYVRDYAERPSRDLLGNQSIDNPPLEYSYNDLSVAWTHRFSSTTRGQIRYVRTERTDGFVGYNDYLQDRVRFALVQRFTPQLRARFIIDYSDRSYPRAFAFDEPTAPAKAYDVLTLGALVEYELRDGLSLYGEIDRDDVSSSDARGEYERLQTTFGVSWLCCGAN